MSSTEISVNQKSFRGAQYARASFIKKIDIAPTVRTTAREKVEICNEVASKVASECPKKVERRTSVRRANVQNHRLRFGISILNKTIGVSLAPGASGFEGYAELQA